MQRWFLKSQSTGCPKLFSSWMWEVVSLDPLILNWQYPWSKSNLIVFSSFTCGFGLSIMCLDFFPAGCEIYHLFPFPDFAIAIELVASSLSGALGSFYNSQRRNHSVWQNWLCSKSCLVQRNLAGRYWTTSSRFQTVGGVGCSLSSRSPL